MALRRKAATMFGARRGETNPAASNPRRSSARVSGPALAVTLLLAVPGVAGAQITDQVAAADAAFQEASRLMAEGKTEEACPKFAASHRLDPGFGAVYNLGSCYKALGKTASAWAAYREAEILARKHHETERETRARTRAAELAPSLVKLRVTLASPQPGVSISRDGTAFDAALLDLEIPVDPGEHTVTATAPGKRPWTTTVDVRAPGTTVVVEIPALRDMESPKIGGPRLDGAPAGGGGLGAQRGAAIGAAGLGVAGIALGTAFGVAALSRWGEARRGHCDAENRCDDAGLSLHRDASTMAHVSTAGFVAGGAGLVGAAVLWLTASPRSAADPGGDDARAARKTGILREVTPVVGSTFGGLSISGSF